MKTLLMLSFITVCALKINTKSQSNNFEVKKLKILSKLDRLGHLKVFILAESTHSFVKLIRFIREKKFKTTNWSGLMKALKFTLSIILTLFAKIVNL